jgi:hypothetical protein
MPIMTTAIERQLKAVAENPGRNFASQQCLGLFLNFFRPS